MSRPRASMHGGLQSAESASMDEREFVAGSRTAWERLAAAVTEGRSVGVTKLGAARLRQMHEDYRHAAADLAYAQTHFPGGDAVTYLNRLVGSAHGELYGSAPRRAAVLWRFLSRDYPRLLRASWRPIALAALLLGGAGVFGFVISHTDYPLARLFLPEQFRQGVGDDFQRTKAANAGLGVLSPAFAAYIGVNNVWVAVLAFTGGMTAGVLTVYSMVMNGALLGVLAGVFSQARLSLDFWALIVPHGAIELPAIVIAGAAGLTLASALLFPGDLPRMTALKSKAQTAVRLVLGTVPMFAIAAVIEGFITPRGFDPLLKIAFGALMALLLGLYWGLAGRERGEAPMTGAGRET
jgi:uncharacterized membrane protein SpoIIM required for sporulation